MGLKKDIETMLKMSMDAPYMEMDRYTQKWQRGMEETDEKHMKYYLYACHVFNTLAAAYHESAEQVDLALSILGIDGLSDDSTLEHCSKLYYFKNENAVYIDGLRSDAIRDGIDVEYLEIVRTHRAWWEACGEDNRLAYSDEFCDWIDRVVRATRQADMTPEELKAYREDQEKKGKE